MSTRAEATRASDAPRGAGPESQGDFWKVYPHTEGGHELAAYVDTGVRRKLRVPKKYETAAERARWAKGAAHELRRQYREEQKSPKLAAVAAADPALLTFGDVADLWASGELATKYPDQVKRKATKTEDQDAARLEVLKEAVGRVPLRSFTVDDAERAMRALPEGAKSPTTRRHYAQLVSRVLALSVYPLRIIAASPIPRGFVPKLGAPKAKTFLYPSEDAKLLACADVPLVFRVLYGFLDREGMREGEALATTWECLDLDRGAVRLDENKTDDPRAWALDPGVVRALVAWKKIHPKNDDPKARVFLDADGHGLDGVHFATEFREKHLRLMARVDRPELFERTKNRMPIRVHDLRATFVTLSLANGKTETWVADRTGHRSTLMISRYRRAARQAEELHLGTLAPLDQAIPELAELVPPSGPRGGVSGTVSGSADVREGSSTFASPESSRALGEARSTEEAASPLLSPLRLPFRQGARCRESSVVGHLALMKRSSARGRRALHVRNAPRDSKAEDLRVKGGATCRGSQS